jgi:hypothetical protein
MTAVHSEEGSEADSLTLGLLNQSIWRSDRQICQHPGPLLLPFEAALISLLLFPQHRRDVTLAVRISRSLALTVEASAIRAKVVLIYHSHKNEAKTRKAVIPGPLFQLPEPRTNVEWMYVPKAGTASSEYLLELCEVLRHPDRTARPVSAHAGYLIPSKNVTQGEGGGAVLWAMALKALEANQLDCFRITVECWRKTEVTFGAFTEPQKRLKVLDLLTSTPFIDPNRYLMILPLSEILDGTDPLSGIVRVAQRPSLFKAVCEMLRDDVRDVDIHNTLFEGSALKTLFEMISDEVIPTAISYFRAGRRDPCEVFSEAFWFSSVSAQIVGWSFQQLKPPIVLKLASRSQELLRSALEDSDGNDDETLERVAFLNEECSSALGFDMEAALSGFAQARHPLPSCPLETLRYIFSGDIQHRIRQIINPVDLPLFFPDDRAIRFALEELQYPLTQAEAETLFLQALLSPSTLDSASFLGPRVSTLAPETLKECYVHLWVRTFDVSPSNRVRVAKLLQLFVAKGWLPTGHRVGAVPPILCGMLLGMPGVRRLAPSSRRFKGDAVCAGLIQVLQCDIGIDFKEGNYGGNFPLSVALFVEAWQVVQYLLVHRLFPDREVLIRYRWQGLTLLHLLFRTTTLDPAENAASDYIDLVRHLGVDVVRELSFVRIQPCVGRDASCGCDGELPLTVACRYWPLEALVYLVNDLDIGGSRGDELKHVLSSLTPGTPAHLFLRQKQEQEGAPLTDLPAGN